MSATVKSILLPGEVELYVKSFEPSRIEDLGSTRWFGVHERLQKLHQQSVLEAGMLAEETVKEAFVSYSKVTTLIHEAICVSVWREQIFPLLLQNEPKPINTFMPYIVLYHEAIAIAVLETILFHTDSCEALEDASIDLIDYCSFALVRLGTLSECNESQEGVENRSSREELQHQQRELAFDIGIRSVAILQFIADSLNKLPLSATSRIFVTHDIPLLFKNLAETRPWCKRNDKGQTLKYIDGKWKLVLGEDEIKLTRTEGQVWLGLRQLLLDPRCPAHYDINDYRKNQLLKLQSYLHDILLDQLSPLIDLKHWLAQLAMSNPPSSSKRPIIVEIVPQIRQSFLERSSKQWQLLAKHQADTFFNSGQEHTMEMAKSLSAVYNLDTLEALTTGSPVCVGCGEPAAKRCSRCKTDWYCGRECQVKSWPKHKTTCDLLAESFKKTDTDMNIRN